MYTVNRQRYRCDGLVGPRVLRIWWPLWMSPMSHGRRRYILLHLAGNALYGVYDGLVVPVVPVPDYADAAVTNVYARSPRKHSTRRPFQPSKERWVWDLLLPPHETVSRWNYWRIPIPSSSPFSVGQAVSIVSQTQPLRSSMPERYRPTAKLPFDATPATTTSASCAKAHHTASSTSPSRTTRHRPTRRIRRRRRRRHPERRRICLRYLLSLLLLR